MVSELIRTSVPAVWLAPDPPQTMNRFEHCWIILIHCFHRVQAPVYLVANRDTVSTTRRFSN